MLYDTEATTIPCARCGNLLEKHTTLGANNTLQSRTFCPKCRESGEWVMTSVAEEAYEHGKGK
jgi:hypothetical protein